MYFAMKCVVNPNSWLEMHDLVKDQAGTHCYTN